MSAHEYNATAVNTDGMWSVKVHGLPDNLIGVTSAQTQLEAQVMTDDVVAELLQVPVDQVRVKIRWASSWS